MSDATVSGVIHLIEETKTFGNKGFRKRLVVLEQDKGSFTNYIPVEFIRKDFSSEVKKAQLDTILIEPDFGRVSLCWRAHTEIKRNIYELQTCIAGRMPKGWYRARKLGKTYYSNLAELTAANSE